MNRVPDIPLLRKCVEWAETEAQKPYRERRWEQSRWKVEKECGTAYCIAGYVIELQGGYEWDRDEVWGDCIRSSDGLGVERVSTVANRLLGLTPEQGDALFYPGNNIQRVRHVAERIAQTQGETL